MMMMASDFIVNVSEADFEYEVLNYSQTTPVVVDFWATWCIPCKVQSPVLEKLAREGQGTFRLAKVDVDANLNLAKRFNIRTIPIVKAFSLGQVVSEFNGALPEPRLREFIRNLAPSPSDLMLEKGYSLLRLHEWHPAEDAFREFLNTSPQNASGLLGLLKSLLSQGLGQEAALIVHNFPPSHEYATADILKPLTEALNKLERGTWMMQDDPLSAAFYNSVRLASRGNIYASLDGLLDIIRQNKRFNNGQPRQLVVALLELLGEEDPQTRQYRQELASILF
jgi:putative thioredoxin